MSDRGFSLIELLLVLVIIALLAGIVAPQFIGRMETAKQQKISADFNTIATALKLYQLDNDVYPGTDQGLPALQEKTRLPPLPRQWKPGGYLETLPEDPWGRAYLYLQPAEYSGGAYDLFTLGADGKRGGEGQDADVFR